VSPILVLWRYFSAFWAMNRGIAIVGFAGDRIDDVADQAQRRHGEQNGSMQAVAGIGHEQHVAVVDRPPAADGRPVEPGAVLEQAFRQFPERNS
jgi:hypothetical protein